MTTGRPSETLSVEYYRARAEELRDAADRAGPEVRATMLDIAMTYDQLIELAERRIH
jgi:hypothetical protein